MAPLCPEQPRPLCCPCGGAPAVPGALPRVSVALCLSCPRGGSAPSALGVLVVALVAQPLCLPCPRSSVRGTLPPRHCLWTEALRGEAAEPRPGARCRLRRTSAVAKVGDSPPHPPCPQGLRAAEDLLPCPCWPQGPAATPSHVPATLKALGTGPPCPCSPQGHVVFPMCLGSPQHHPPHTVPLLR